MKVYLIEDTEGRHPHFFLSLRQPEKGSPLSIAGEYEIKSVSGLSVRALADAVSYY